MPLEQHHEDEDIPDSRDSSASAACPGSAGRMVSRARRTARCLPPVLAVQRRAIKSCILSAGSPVFICGGQLATAFCRRLQCIKVVPAVHTEFNNKAALRLTVMNLCCAQAPFDPCTRLKTSSLGSLSFCNEYVCMTPSHKSNVTHLLAKKERQKRRGSTSLVCA